MRRISTLFATALIASCSSEANHLGNPLLWPVHAVTSGVENAIYDARRGEVEVHVKSNYPDILHEIEADGGAILTEAMDLALVAEVTRPARITQMQADLPLYAEGSDALIVALMVYGG